MKIFNFLINSNIYISLAAVALTVETQLQLGMAPQWHPYLFIIFFATLFDYNLHRLVTLLTNKEALNDDKHKWLKEYLNLFYALVVFSVIGFLIAVLLAKKEVLITLAPFALITFFYSLPIFKNQKYLFRLREIPFLKIFLISIVWSATTILLPIIQSGRHFDSQHVSIMLIERFLFVFAITIPFDIRDIHADIQSGLTTIPNFIGSKKSLVIANFLMISFLLISCFHYSNAPFQFILPAFIISGISTIFFFNIKSIQNLTFYHYGILDGTMLLQGILVWLAHTILV
ncbi:MULTISPECIES: UbiA family prenyltransferase [unclassified Arcicella]|uniref:UbiA family prenyltransferase n=1 Tax=unclassified Arcicella TaxID=2644986 RepID=UPI0028565610|nr:MULTISPECIES: UbiA family prenyltransferase [unclassified Arcicella]MDR6560041.1 4-hydroxybenzoate polyprenyltransferase [Arcicella sp. BE51]MDR6810352.1 4-hydroxybenzoate polyprenyltransferase [Arcicella sp. BE140]MDR6821702.1 4-hydroxybenzoate polyprenyltransferase [Arcicella sp. BE139]